MRSVADMTYAHPRGGQTVETDDENSEAILESPSSVLELSKGVRKEKRMRCVNLTLHIWTMLKCLRNID